MHCAHESSRCAPGLSRIMLWRLVGSDRMSRLSLCTVSRYPEVVVKVVVGRMVNTRRTRGCCTILTRMTTLVREIIKSEGAPDRAPAEPGVAGRCPISTLQTFTALKGRRAHAHPSHDAARSPAAGTWAAMRVDVRGATGEDGTREAHTTGARRPASCHNSGKRALRECSRHEAGPSRGVNCQFRCRYKLRRAMADGNRP